VEHCKTVGSAYVGSNPTPATTCENGPLAAETRPGGPFPSCRAVYQGASLWVDAWQCARTYGVQRPGETSGAYNRSLCRSTPVLSLYAGARTARLTGAFRASVRPGSPAFCSRWAAGWSCSYLRRGRLPDRRRHPIDAAPEAVTECTSPAAGWRLARCRASDAAGGSGRCTSGGRHVCKGFPVFRQGLDLAKPVMYLSWTGDVPVVYLHLVPLRCTSHGPGRCDVHRPITSGHRHQAWRRDPGDRVICGRKPVGTVSCSTSAALAVSRRWQLRAAWPLTRRPVPARGTRRSDGGVCSPVVVICRGSSGGRHGSAGWLGCMSDVWQGAIPATTEIPGSRLASRCLCRPSG